MNATIDKRRLRFYGWVAIAFLSFAWLGNLVRHTGTFWVRSLNDCWLLCYLFVLNIILFEFTFRYIQLNWKRILTGLLLLWIHILLYSFGLKAWRSLGISLHVYTDLVAAASKDSVIEYMFGYSLSTVFFFGIVRHIYNYIRLKQATQQLRIEKQQAEMNYLKSQTNPHFLFNTLNNIYSLSRDKSDLAPESIMRLSKILRFMLYETSGNFIALEQELKIISDYIALEKLRYDESLLVNFNYNVEDMKQSLPPLLLIPLVENAFKHGVSETRYRPFVDIHLSVSRRQLHFVVKNSTGEGAEGGSVKEQIGLSNLRRQLELLYTEFNLSVQQDERAFKATLHINLASHV